MGARFVAAVIGLIVVVVLAQSLLSSGSDETPSIRRPSSIPTATPPPEQEPVLLGQSQAGPAAQGAGGTAGGATYTVRSGDTLVGIAANLGVEPGEQAAWVSEVLRLNDMQDARQLRSGQELRLPARTAAAAGPTPRPADTPASGSPTPTPPPAATGTVPTPTPRPGGTGGTYTVVSGDFPLLIAEKHCVEEPLAWAAQLVELNGVAASSLRVGTVLNLPAGTPPLCVAPGAPAPTPQA